MILDLFLGFEYSKAPIKSKLGKHQWFWEIEHPEPGVPVRGKTDFGSLSWHSQVLCSFLHDFSIRSWRQTPHFPLVCNRQKDTRFVSNISLAGCTSTITLHAPDGCEPTSYELLNHMSFTWFPHQFMVEIKWTHMLCIHSRIFGLHAGLWSNSTVASLLI